MDKSVVSFVFHGIVIPPLHEYHSSALIISVFYVDAMVQMRKIFLFFRKIFMPKTHSILGSNDLFVLIEKAVSEGPSFCPYFLGLFNIFPMEEGSRS